MPDHLPPDPTASHPLCILVPEFGFSAGTETVLLRVASAWALAGHRVVLVAPSSRLRQLRQRGLDARVIVEDSEWPAEGWQRLPRALSRAGRLPAAVRRRFLSWRLSKIAARHRADVAFVPWIFDQPAPDLPVPFGALAMDLAWRHFPEGTYSHTSGPELDRRFAAWLVRAFVVFPVSESTAAELSAAFPEHAERFHVVPHGAEIIPVGAAAMPTPVHPPLFLYPASLTANKGHLLLLRAAALLYAEGLDFRLVFVGRDTDGLSDASRPVPASLGPTREYFAHNRVLFRGRVEALGFTDATTLARLHASAWRVVLPSAYEGFGLPLVEAFARRANILCSDIPAFREQIARYSMEDHAPIVSAPTAEAWADALRSAMDKSPAPLPETELRARLERWTWSDAARAYIDALHRPTQGTP